MFVCFNNKIKASSVDHAYTYLLTLSQLHVITYIKYFKLYFMLEAFAFLKHLRLC